MDPIIIIDDWPILETAYPEGARDKDALYCPSKTPFDFLIPGHRYLFKRSNKRYPEQYWVEIVAYKIGCLMNVKVPPAFIGINTTSGLEGALIEWFYGHPGHPPTRYFPGGDYCIRHIEGFNRTTGEQHNFQFIKSFFIMLQKRGFLLDDWLEHWAKVFVFDAIIGNTDRHQDNWGIIWWLFEGKQQKVSISPAFDNGTSMGHEIVENNFYKFRDVNYMKRYVERGTHHMKWQKTDKKGCGHFEMLSKIAEEFPEVKDVMLKALDFSMDELGLIFSELISYNASVPLTKQRADFMLELVRVRREAILSILV